MGHSSCCHASLGYGGAKLIQVKGEMKTRRGGTVQDPVTPGAPSPLPQPSSISHHWEQAGDPSAARLRPGRGGAGEDLCSWTSHLRARLGTTTQKTWDRRCLENCSSVSTHNSARGLHHRPEPARSQVHLPSKNDPYVGKHAGSGPRRCAPLFTHCPPLTEPFKVS